MTSTTTTPQDDKAVRTLEEICENTRAIRRVVNRILDHLHESQESYDDDPYPLDWEDLDNDDDMYY
jgi:hypothetical protein